MNLCPQIYFGGYSTHCFHTRPHLAFVFQILCNGFDISLCGEAILLCECHFESLLQAWHNGFTLCQNCLSGRFPVVWNQNLNLNNSVHACQDISDKENDTCGQGFRRIGATQFQLKRPGWSNGEFVKIQGETSGALLLPCR